MHPRLRCAITLVGTLFCFAGYHSIAFGQITSVVSSEVEGFFGSQSDAFQLSEPPINPTWTANATGPYGVGGPTVPAIYPGFPNPSLTYTSTIAYDTGHTGPGFADTQLTAANYDIVGNFSGGANTGDAFAMTGTGGMTLVQPPSATGFTYEKVEFVMTYGVGPAGLASGVAPAYPFLVSGNVFTGGYAEFGAQIDYWWQPVIPGTIIPSGPASNLGTLQYSFLQPGGGSFSQVVNHSGPVLAGVGAGSIGFLQITGHMFVAGDPFSISVVSVPEPSTLALAGIGVLALAVTAARRRFA